MPDGEVYRNAMVHIGGVRCALLLSVFLLPGASAQTDQGPGFDPTPLQIPQVAQTAPRPVTSMDLLNLRDFRGSKISPDGKWVAFVLGQAVYENNSYRSGLFVVGTEKGSQPVCLGTAGPPHWDVINQWWAEDPQWSADSRHIYYRMKTADTWQVWRWDRKGGSPTQVTHLERSVQSYTISPEGDKLNLIVEKPPTIDKVQLAEHGILYDGSFEAGIPAPFVDQIAAAHPVETESWMHDIKIGRERRPTSEENMAYSSWDYTPHGTLFSKNEIDEQGIFRVKISPDGKQVLYQRWVMDPSESEQLVYPLFSRPLQGGTPVPLTPGVYDPEEFWWSANNQEIYYSEYDSTGADDVRPSKLMAVPVGGGKARQVLDSAGFQYNYSMDRAGRFLACNHENITTPTELRLIDLSTGEMRTLVDVNPEFQNLQLSPGKRIDVTNKYGDHFWAHLLLPPNYVAGKLYPLVLTTYRDGEEFFRGAAGDEYPIQVLAANGFAVLNFDIGRVRNSKSDDFETSLLSWDSPVDGMRAAIAKLIDMCVVDASRIGITGWSHGAEITSYAISHKDLFRVAIASGAGWEPILYELASDSQRAELARTFYLESPDGPSRSRWQRESAALNAQRIATPLLVNAADSEYLYGIQLVHALRELKKPVEMFIYANELHVKNQPKHRYEIYQRNLDWLNYWLRDREDPNPAKAEQYARWRELRRIEEQNEKEPSSESVPH